MLGCFFSHECRSNSTRTMFNSTITQIIMECRHRHINFTRKGSYSPLDIINISLLLMCFPFYNQQQQDSPEKDLNNLYHTSFKLYSQLQTMRGSFEQLQQCSA